MSRINFPSNPNVGDVYSFGGSSWRWSGTAWKRIALGATVSAT